MRKITTLLITTLSLSFPQVAYGKDYDVILNKQAAQINALISRIESLESTVQMLQGKVLGQNAAPVNQPAMPQESVADKEVHLAESADEAQDEEQQNAKIKKLFMRDNTALGQEKVDYDLALAKLKEGKFAEAEEKFSAFLKKYPQSTLQSNAMFWYAETFYRRDIYNNAAIQYLNGYKKYPKGPKAADSLLKLSLSLARLNKATEACGMLDKLEKEFPDRPMDSIKRAREARSKFGCSALNKN